MLAVSFATLAASASVYIFGKITLDKLYAQERQRDRDLYKHAFHSILHRFKGEDMALSWLIPSLVEPQLSSRAALTKLKELIEVNWFKIGLESDIESVYLFSREGELIGHWGTSVDATEVFSDIFNQAVEKEEPVEHIFCTQVCTQIYVSPFLHNGEFIGVFIFSLDMTETVIQMQRITGSDVGILVKNTNAVNSSLPYLDKFSASVVALTNRKKNLPMLTTLMKETTIEQLRNILLFDYEQKNYEISLIPFVKGKESAELIIIDDITDELTDVQKAASLYAANGLLSLLLSGGILLVLLIGPTRRLRMLINALPLIAEKRYQEVVKLLPERLTTSFLKDEINVLDEATHNLMLALKHLDSEVEKRTENLSKKTIELQKEKNFVSNILNTAQVIIMTLDENEKIISFNKYGEKLIGLNNSETEFILFTDLILDPLDFEEISTALNHLSENQKESFHYECKIASASKDKLFISWYFTHIKSPDNTSEILVVGLDLTERNHIESQLTWLADHDPLTNLYNRRRFEHEFKRTLSLAARYNQPGALIYFDIDQFKFVNDSSGHKVGDELLVKVSNKLKLVTRESDLIARLGGDEFIVLAPYITIEHAQELVEKICLEMNTIEISKDQSVHRVSISAGLLLFPIQGYSEQDMLASVDLAMYKAKQTNRGSWCLASIEDLNREEILTRVNWKFNIQQALEDEQFLLYFQPIKCIADNSIIHYECLLRMRDETGDIVSPGLFLNVAEQTGLMSLIDRRVLELAFQYQAGLIKENLDIILSVNLSGELISNPRSFEIVLKLLEKYNVPAAKFIFEVTESQAVTNLFAAQNFMRQINEIGGHFALDDFGVGFSSMSYLKQLPVQYLKIDGGFVKNLHLDHEDKLFVQAINNVGRGMGLKTIAEYVENEQIYEALRYIGVDYAQGFAIGKPMSFLEFHKMGLEN